ncbi:hypothetical protein D3C84_825550 [compost metagenome]
MRGRVAIDAFIGVMVAITHIGKLIDMVDQPYLRADIGRRVQAERGFPETPVTHRLIVAE